MTVKTETQPIRDQIRNKHERNNMLNPFPYMKIAALTGVLAARTIRRKVEESRRPDEDKEEAVVVGDLAVSSVIELQQPTDMIPVARFSNVGNVEVRIVESQPELPESAE